MPDKNETVSFRIDSKLLKALRDDAKHEQISLNSLVHKIFFMHANWYTHSIKNRLFMFPVEAFVDILNELSDEQIIEHSKKFAKKTIALDYTLGITGKSSADAFFSTLNFWAKSSGFDFQTNENEDYKGITIMHNAGKKFSLLISLYFRSIFDSYKVKYTVDITDHQIIVQLYN